KYCEQYLDLLYMIILLFFFFFSSRRRHTRSKRDWRSDVCSSDLKPMQVRSRDANLSRWSIASGDMMVSIDGFLIEECRDLTRIIPLPDTSVRASTSPIANWRKSLFRTSAVD